jgi:hypothetical protein
MIVAREEHSWVEEESDKISTALVKNMENQLNINMNQEKFYDNWYFYQEYKNKLKDSFPFEIKYVSL